ncbi:MAG TPA: PDZ domain-containing protein [Bryobacteraceae bacterium]|jgi:predicted metalloprotease with PDZ domain|nr:PDZ domain-containing protein [Bryobacteraceae bacterium]
MVENHQTACFHPLQRGVRYLVSFPAPHTHYVSVMARLPAAGLREAEIFMPVWTPGSYMVREYVRHVEDVRVSGPDGKPLSFTKSRKNRWRVETGGAEEIHFSYRVYCREMSVRTNWVEDSFALLNGAPTFVTLVGGLNLPHEVKLELPETWKTSVSGLPEAPGGEPHHYLAPDYDTIVDSPILAGNPAVYRFDVNGVPHLLVNVGEAGVWDGPRSAADLEKIVRECSGMWGPIPCERYVFLNLLTESGGGLEHRNSVCMMASRWATRTPKAYIKWLDLAAHEYFHVWNVKRLRPAELGPFDYENENLTRSLWVAEGFTEYYTGLLVCRAGLCTQAEYLGSEDKPRHASLSGLIGALQSTPGRLLQSAEQASWDAWIKLYRPDENSKNTSISYYIKGAVIGWLLDARIRRQTSGAKSLDDLMRLALQRFSGEHGFTPSEFKAAAEEVAGTSLQAFFARAVESTEELDYGEALDWFGLRFKATLGPAADAAKKAWLGADTRTDHGRLIVSHIPRESLAWDSGLSVDDEIVAIGDFRVQADKLFERLENYRPGDSVSLLVARRERMLRFDLTVGEEPHRLQLEPDPEATPIQKQNMQIWLASSAAR